MKRSIALFLTLCMVLVFFVPVAAATQTTLYFLNTKGWSKVNAYIYGDKGELLGSWPGTGTTADAGQWVKVTVSDSPAYSVIFFNTADDAQRTELYLDAANKTYVTADGQAYTTKAQAELAAGVGAYMDVYYYNTEGWSDVGAYVYGDCGEVLGSWPGTDTQSADIGSNWLKISVPAEPPFNIIFHQKSDATETLRAELSISNSSNVYVAGCKADGNVAAYTSQAEAEASIPNQGGNTNPDYLSYNISYNGAGAALPYITYEAENAITNGEVLEKATVYRQTPQSEASGRQAVKLDAVGEYVEFTLAEPANSLVLRSCLPDSTDGSGITARLSMYIDGTEKTDLSLTSKYAWVYGNFPYSNNPADGLAHRFFDETRLLLDETLPAGTTIRLQKNPSDTAPYYIIDFIECELVAAPLSQPSNSLSVLNYGAVANDGIDDYDAFQKCITAAKRRGREVWIPAGTFDLTSERTLSVDGVTIRGAGMWHTTLQGAGAAFSYAGTARFFDFAMTGVSYYRDDDGDLAGFETGSSGTNVTIQNIWMEHMKVGVWSAYTTGLTIQGCRIRNTFADGINLCSDTHNSTVQNNSLRNTGDDSIASWPWQADCTGNTIYHNTVQIPTLANGIAVYGGGNYLVEGNYIADTINNGAGIAVGSEFSTVSGFTGVITVQNNVMDRCGSMQTDENYPIGAIWIWASWGDMTTGYNIFSNTMNDCIHEGILIECSSKLTGLNIQKNTISGATNAVYEYLNGSGTGTVGSMTVSGLTGDAYKDDAPNFHLIHAD